MGSLFCLAPGAFDLSLGLLNHAFNPEFGIVRQLAHLTLGAPHHFVDSSFHSIFIHRSTSVDLSFEE
jgi:hypothetical protein